MIRAKIFAIYAFVGVFVAIAITGLLGVFHVITLPEAVMASAFIGPCLGIITAAFNAKHLFEDPEAVTELKHKHTDEMLSLKASHAEREAQSAKASSEREAQVVARERAAATQQQQRDQQTLAILQAENQQLKVELQKKQMEVERQQRIAAARQPKRPMPAPGSATQIRRVDE